MKTWLTLGLMIALVAPAGAQQCPERRVAQGDLGIEALLCTGATASCSIYSGDGAVHRFSVEPRIQRLDRAGPASDQLRVGDVIVAVDSLMITTTEGGRRLASVQPGQQVRLLVRRNGALLEQIIAARRGCGIRSLSVSTKR